MRVLATLCALALQAMVPAQYVVLCGVPADDPYRAAAVRLAAYRKATLRDFDPTDLAAVRDAFRKAPPRHVALVVRPEQLDFTLARAFLQLATEIDEDPFVDFEYGFVTGRTADDALAFVKRSERAAERPRKATELAEVCGGLDASRLARQPYQLRKGSLPSLQAYVKGSSDAAGKGNAGHDRAFVAELLPKLKGASLVTFVGHGMPDEVVGGPDAADLAALELDLAVVLNVACYTGVTHGWFEQDWRAGKVVRRVVPPEESFGLAVLRAGVIGYTAYTCPRPAGPELDTDLVELIARGASLGGARRRDYDKTVLGFLGYGEARLQLLPVADGQPLGQVADPVREMMLEGATGGILFGDPALVPFVARPDEAPVQVTWQRRGAQLAVEASCPAYALYLQCNDPTAQFDGKMAMKVHARVPIGKARIADVAVDQLTVGGKVVPTRHVFAFEQDQREHFAQVKVMFPRSDGGGELTARLRILLTDDPKQAKAMGGEVVAPRRPAAAIDVRSTAIQPAMLELATKAKVSREVLQTALNATAAELDVAGLDRAACRKALADAGSEGFRAVCVLIELGHTHYRSVDLLASTWKTGDEARLLELAARKDLPNFAAWTVLEGLAVADTPAVRKHLHARLQHETDAGLFMAAAKGLARLRDEKAVAAIGARLLERRQGWQGVAPHLVEALRTIGGEAAARALAEYEKGR
jgi:hypothetical protein